MLSSWWKFCSFKTITWDWTYLQLCCMFFDWILDYGLDPERKLKMQTWDSLIGPSKCYGTQMTIKASFYIVRWYSQLWNEGAFLCMLPFRILALGLLIHICSTFSLLSNKNVVFFKFQLTSICIKNMKLFFFYRVSDLM